MVRTAQKFIYENNFYSLIKQFDYVVSELYKSQDIFIARSKTSCATENHFYYEIKMYPSNFTQGWCISLHRYKKNMYSEEYFSYATLTRLDRLRNSSFITVEDFLNINDVPRDIKMIILFNIDLFKI